jgi:hypothetical protein
MFGTYEGKFEEKTISQDAQRNCKINEVSKILYSFYIFFLTKLCATDLKIISQGTFQLLIKIF